MPIKPFAAMGVGASAITVPSTGQLIVETLSLQVDVVPPGTRLEAFVNYKCGGQDIQLFVPLIYAYTQKTVDYHVAMQEVRLYPDKGTTMGVTVYAPGGNPETGGTLFLTVSGQLV
jgi:hypothetical protein